MANVGRFFCVFLPFALTVASLICILIVALAGVTNKNLDMFDINTQNLSISTNDFANLVNIFKRVAEPEPVPLPDLSDLPSEVIGNLVSGTNLTASELGLSDFYKIDLWTYCNKTAEKTHCPKPKFDWANSAVNVTKLEETASASVGKNVTLPKELTSALHTFKVLSKWTQVVYIIAFVATAAELLFGLFALCSRIGSCCTWIISGISTVAIICASVLATVVSAVVVGALDKVVKNYGVHAKLNTTFLAITWLAAAFSIAGSLFWLFSVCCCAPEKRERHRDRRNFRGSSDGEKLLSGGLGGNGYQRVGDPYGGQETGYTGRGVPLQNFNKPTRVEGGYEPYSHAAV
ncbi:SUR7 protein-like protein [Xylogone sp. PMI_703]|nr:SUR7 protein-like protein [Xylogone sp. PMI_703]